MIQKRRPVGPISTEPGVAFIMLTYITYSKSPTSHVLNSQLVVTRLTGTLAT